MMLFTSFTLNFENTNRSGTPVVLEAARGWKLALGRQGQSQNAPFTFQARLLSSISMLAGIFVAIAAVIFSTYFDQLVVLRRDLGHFVTDNDSMHSVASKVMAVSLNGLSLTVVSFTIVFLFHGVGGGLYCGTVLFRYV